MSVPRSGNEEVRSQAQNRGVQVGDVLRGLIRRDGTEETFVSKEHAEKVINDHHRLPANHAKHTGQDDGPARAVYGTTFKLSFSRRPAAALVEKKAGAIHDIRRIVWRSLADTSVRFITEVEKALNQLNDAEDDLSEDPSDESGEGGGGGSGGIDTISADEKVNMEAMLVGGGDGDGSSHLSSMLDDWNRRFKHTKILVYRDDGYHNHVIAERVREIIEKNDREWRGWSHSFDEDVSCATDTDLESAWSGSDGPHQRSKPLSWRAVKVGRKGGREERSKSRERERERERETLAPLQPTHVYLV